MVGQLGALNQVGVENGSAVAMAAGLSAGDCDSRWYAAYTIARHEKCVAQQMEERGIEYLLPLYRSMRRWKDRRKQVEFVLFPSYVFVHMALRDRLQVLQLPSVVYLVGFNGSPVPLPESEITALRGASAGKVYVEPYPYLKAGQRVRVHSGLMAGLEGILLREKERLRVVFSVDLIMRSVAVEVDRAEIMLIS
jgi:transcription antitermination factor NusG